MSQTRDWGDLQRAADHLGVSQKTVRNWIADGSLKAYRMPGKSRLIRVDMNELDATVRQIPAA